MNSNVSSACSGSIAPFLKWAGGKRWLVHKHGNLFPDFSGRYIEPFLGSGAVFFHLKPEDAVISDSNSWLIDTYVALRDDWQSVFELLKKHQHKHSKNYYYEMRAFSLEDKIERAAQFIYLNRTCWNGLFRVNLSGKFNVPIGTKSNVLLEDGFLEISEILSNANILNVDFEKVVDLAVEGDFLFVDPPYTVKHNLNGFVKYNEKIFSWDDQERLFYSLRRAKERGVKIMLTNANHSSILSLYEGFFDIQEIERASVISANKDFRSRTTELLIS
ncbi:DNA adenine methylase [Chromohalobacter beijerinckii]|uniref:site-specific DNA-methyltransferase (adenine-specific) n=1 Tax=Chromohalobacter beijerinckii TaxID=86179 RepID=A0ABV8X954_9GAMM|nr:Dam family site-specific DNA-(adenine-N6)-methyltransferase [Chromohalobacter beijerinckii]MCK0766350.1 Dam family site-specific DNA-(adenine-N6)-methyltransferase [Chromohalobacter beijerinckii]